MATNKMQNKSFSKHLIRNKNHVFMHSMLSERRKIYSQPIKIAFFNLKTV